MTTGWSVYPGVAPANMAHVKQVNAVAHPGDGVAIVVIICYTDALAVACSTGGWRRTELWRRFPVSDILIIEDEAALAKLLTRLLAGAGYRVRVAATGEDGLRQARASSPDLTILDLMLPDIRGEDVLIKMLQEGPDCRVLVLSSVTQVAARVAVLTSGAADFLAKPFATAELFARISARIRRPEAAAPRVASPSRLYRREFDVDAKRQEIVTANRRIKLSQREYTLLTHLFERAPDPCSRAELLAAVWGSGYDTGTNVVDVYVGRLRAKLQSNSIETVRNVGYRLIPA